MVTYGKAITEPGERKNNADAASTLAWILTGEVNAPGATVDGNLATGILTEAASMRR